MRRLVIRVGGRARLRKLIGLRPSINLFKALVAVGVAGELLADGGLFLCGHRLQALADVELGSLNLEASTARRDAELFNLARIKMEKELLDVRVKVQDRVLTPDQRARLVKCLRDIPVPHGPVWIGREQLVGAQEPEFYWSQLVSVFQEASFFGTTREPPRTLSLSQRGVLLLFAEDAHSRKLALAIQKCLVENGVRSVEVNPSGVEPILGWPTVVIWIGQKP